MKETHRGTEKLLYVPPQLTLRRTRPSACRVPSASGLRPDRLGGRILVLWERKRNDECVKDEEREGGHGESVPTSITFTPAQ